MSGALAKSNQLRAADQWVQAGRPDEAEAIYQHLLAANPIDGEVLLAWGRLRRATGDAPAAAQLLQRAITASGGPVVKAANTNSTAPAASTHTAAQLELAGLLVDHGNLGPAETLLRQLMAQLPHLAAVHFLLGRVQAARGNVEQAADLFRAAMRADPNLTEARHELARTLAGLGRLEEAANAYRALLKRAPNDVVALLGQGKVLGQLNRFHEALACYDRAEALGADIAWALGELVLALAHICDWGPRAALYHRLRARLASPVPCLVEPFAVLCQDDDPAIHLQVGQQLAETVRLHMAKAPRPTRLAAAGDKIRLGYLSSDFNQHATALLMADIFAHHDRARFEVVAWSYSHDDGTPTRRRVAAAFDRFEELQLEPPAESARRIAAAGTDILIDLKGYTTGARPEIAVLRPAPVQVNMLGYPATMAAPWFDYVIADPVVLPMDRQPWWSERIVHLPHSYQPNDRTRPMPAATTRAEHGLPADAFVFACFNSSYKITPEQFSLWMELLRELPDAVLWLYHANSFADQALRTAAERLGVSARRLHFAPPMALAGHLARHGCADLFLDTAPYGAHTTASDALWAGLPLLTWAGNCMPSRVAASLLHAMGVPDLAASSREEYKAMALRLARDLAALRALRDRLEQAHATAPLFDAPRYAANLDKAFLTMMELHRAGRAPEPFAVPDDGAFYRSA